MNVEEIDRINIDMRDGSEWIGVKTIPNATKLDVDRLAFEHDGSMVVVNWSDVKTAYFYKGED